jgi:hypothetical protein
MPAAGNTLGLAKALVCVWHIGREFLVVLIGWISSRNQEGEAKYICAQRGRERHRAEVYL